MSEKNGVISFVAGALGATLATGLILTWAVNNPVRVFELLGNYTDGQDSTVKTISLSESGESSVVSVVKAASPAVVSIVVTKDVPVVEQFFEEFNPFGGFGNPFGFRVPRLRENGTEKQEIGGGSGFLVADTGLIVTNKHVVSEEEVEYTVFTNGGDKYEAQIVARDPANDIAVLKIEANGLPFLEFGSSENLHAGQTAIAIGNALGEFRNTVSVGVISGLSRSIQAGNGFGQAEQLDDVIQTDAAINPGNSGGPLLNTVGQVIGVNVAVALGSENIGFALPADLVKSVVDSVEATGKISRPMLGVRYVMITPAIVEQNQLAVNDGALIIGGQSTTELAVIPGSPADKAGLEQGDIILEMDGEALNTDNSLASFIRKKQVGQTVSLRILHDGAEETRRVVLEEFSN